MKQKAQDPYCYSSRYQGMWLRRFIVERVTQSLRRMIYDTPKETCRQGKSSDEYVIIPETSTVTSFLTMVEKLPHF